MPVPQLEWDEAKRQRTLATREIDFADFGAFWDGRPIVEQRDQRHTAEARYLRYGRLHGRLLVVVWTPRGETVRIISVRAAGRREQREIGYRIPYIWRVAEPRPTGAHMATNWDKVDATTDEDIARQIAEDPDTAPFMTLEDLRDAVLIVNGVRTPLADLLPPAADAAPAESTADEPPPAHVAGEG